MGQVNDRREQAGLPPLTQRALAEAAGVDKDTVSRMARNVLIGKHLLGILDRLSTALSEAGDRQVRPGDLIRTTSQRGPERGRLGVGSKSKSRRRSRPD